jgi:hypothetical protein
VIKCEYTLIMKESGEREIKKERLNVRLSEPDFILLRRISNKLRLTISDTIRYFIHKGKDYERTKTTTSNKPS